jgi:hypothetical protein
VEGVKAEEPATALGSGAARSSSAAEMLRKRLREVAEEPLLDPPAATGLAIVHEEEGRSLGACPDMHQQSKIPVLLDRLDHTSTLMAAVVAWQ